MVAIKQSLVKALSQHGVGQAEINRIRKELGLAPDGAEGQSLSLRKIVPLSRQQIREILDRNADAINKHITERDPRAGRIRSSAHIYPATSCRRSTRTAAWTRP